MRCVAVVVGENVNNMGRRGRRNRRRFLSMSGGEVRRMRGERVGVNERKDLATTTDATEGDSPLFLQTYNTIVVRLDDTRRGRRRERR